MTLEEALEQFKQGKFVIIADDVDGEALTTLVLNKHDSPTIVAPLYL